jgi:hypothetical protein
MSPTFFAGMAERHFSHRWWFFAAAAAGAALVFAAATMAPPPVAFVAGVLAGPLIALPWALLCACLWFHPQRGKLQPGNRWVGRLPPLVQAGMRWYAALFLGLFMAAAALLWPALVITTL